MNWITKPNRAYGVGETKSQNAVIKVYSVAELKRALTQIYQLANGVGTIEIATDIVITEPIKLKTFDALTIPPKEIIIQCVSGARIINGSKTTSSQHNYGIANYNYIPVFDFGYLNNSTTNSCKYTFKDITINYGKNELPFGAFIAAGVAGNATTSKISIINLKAFNMGIIFGAYNTSGSFSNIIFGQSYEAKNISVDNQNVPAGITGIYLTTPGFSLISGNISDYGVIEPTYITSNVVLFFDAGNSSNCLLQNINTLAILNSTNPSVGNTLIGCRVVSNNTAPVVAMVNCLITTGGIGYKTQFPTDGFFGEDSRNGLTLYYNKGSGDPGSIHTIYNIASGTALTLTDIDAILNNAGGYMIDYNITAKYSTGEINNYILRLTVRFTGGVYVITGASTDYAQEDLLTLTQTLSVTAGGVRLRLQDTGSNAFIAAGSVKITGLGMIT